MRFELTTVAETGARFSDFGPYVPSINDAGTVAFWAALRGGGAGLFTSDGGALRADDACSHPAIDGAGRIGYYTPRGVFVDGTPIAELGGELRAIGPLGPTVNAGGTVAFRATAERAAVFVGGVRVAESFRSFEGLPVVTDTGAVVFRADDGIYRWDSGRISPLVELGAAFRALGGFPFVNAAGAVAFAATRADGTEGAFVADGGAITVIHDDFDTYRGALLTAAGDPIFYAAPSGRQLGIYAGAAAEPVLAVGDALRRSTVTAFALNPVSINAAGHLAIRVELADGTGAVVRAEPLSP